VNRDEKESFRRLDAPRKQVPAIRFGKAVIATWFVGFGLYTNPLVTLAETVPTDGSIGLGVSTSHWAFVPPRVPTIKNSSASNGAVPVGGSIDALLRAQLNR